MSTSYNYNPNPPRVWSRVQNPCTFIIPDISYNYNYIPITKETLTQSEANYEKQLFNKGNILQYKGNSFRQTKKQKYSQLAKGFGPNRTKNFATQTQTYTNPNTTSLLRNNYITYPYPNEIISSPNNISGPFQYNVNNPFDCSSNSLQDGGTLICGTYVNPCSEEIIQTSKTSPTICNSSSASNVPGNSILCWNNKIQTWFPRQRYFMNNSGNKWSQGYKGFQSSLTPKPPVLFLESYTSTSISLIWTDINNNICIPISNYNIYQNGILINIVPYSIKNITINNLNGINKFYIISKSYSINSKPSNIITQQF